MEKNQPNTKNISYQLDLFSDINDLSETSTKTTNTNECKDSGLVIKMHSYKSKQQIELYYEAAKRLTAHLD